MDMHTWQVLAASVVAVALCIGTLVVTVKDGHL